MNVLVKWFRLLNRPETRQAAWKLETLYMHMTTYGPTEAPTRASWDAALDGLGLAGWADQHEPEEFLMFLGVSKNDAILTLQWADCAQYTKNTITLMHSFYRIN